MDARDRDWRKRTPLIAAVLLSALLIGTTVGGSTDTTQRAGPSSAPDSPFATGEQAKDAVAHNGPVARLTSDRAPSVTQPGADIHSAWNARPAGAGPRNGSSCTYDNGPPIEDLGDPASQLSEEPAPLPFQFIGASADDFEIVELGDPEGCCHVTLVRGAFSLSEELESMVDWLSDPTQGTNNGIFVTVYPNSYLNDPAGEPDENGGQSGEVVVSQFVPVESLINEVLVGDCRHCFQIDIPVNFILAKNTKYWLSLVPRFASVSPDYVQSFWCISDVAEQWLPAHQGFPPESIPYWTEINGNADHASCAAQEPPPAGTNKDLSFIVYGQEPPAGFGACCNQATGECRNVLTSADCTGPFEVFTADTPCEFLDPPCEPITGACCDDNTSICINDELYANCDSPSLRFVPGVACVDLNPGCGETNPGACCIPGQVCEDQTPTDCSNNGGVWYSDLCATPDFYCPLDNDDCEEASSLEGNGMYFFDTRGATTDGPIHAGCPDINQDVWFEYIATCTGTLTASLCYATDYDSTLLIYDGWECAAEGFGPVLGCDDDGCGTANGPSMLTQSVFTGYHYLIRVGGAGTATGTGYLSISCVPANEGACCFPTGECQVLSSADCSTAGGNYQGDGVACEPSPCLPDNDDCANATLLTGSSVSRPYNTLAATTDGPTTGCGDIAQDIWFGYDVPCDGTVVITTLGSDYDTALAVYDFNGGAGCPDPSLCPTVGSLELACNDDSEDLGAGSLLSKVSITASTGDCLVVRVGGKDLGAGLSGGEGVLHIDCTPTDLGACCLNDGLTCESLDSDACLALNGVWTADEPCSAVTCPLPNDDCDNAIPIAEGTYSFDTQRATTDGPSDSPGDPCTDVNHDIWFAYTPTFDCELVVSLCEDTDYDAALAVYGSCDCRPGILGPPISCDNDGCGEVGGPSEVRVAVTSGTCYLIRVGGAGSATGTGTMIVGCLGTDEGACCDVFTRECTHTIAEDCLTPNEFYLGDVCSEYTCPLAPDNDLCEDAEALPSDKIVSIEYDTSIATTDTCDQPTACGDIVQDIWYSYEVPCNGSVSINTVGGSYDTLLAVYNFKQTGEDCPYIARCMSLSYLYRLGCNDDIGPEETASSVILSGQFISDCLMIRVGGNDPGETGLNGGAGVLNITCIEDDEGACCDVSEISCSITDAAGCVEPDEFHLGEPCELITCPEDPGPPCCPGDANGDNVLDGEDVDPFIEIMLNAGAWSFGTWQFCWADVNKDFLIDLDDIPPFVQKLLDGEECPAAETGACCFVSGACDVLLESRCIYLDGSYQGDGTDCSPNPCLQPPAACCFEDGNCEVLDSDACSVAEGDYQGAGTDCSPNLCPQPPVDCCIGDANEDNEINALDIQRFVEIMIAQPPVGTLDFCYANVAEDLALNDADVTAFVQLVLEGASCGLLNDDCADAAEIDCNSQVIVDNTTATVELEDPTFSCRNGGPGQGVGTVWYTFQATDTTAEIGTCNSTEPPVDTELAVYSGTCGAFAELACSEDDCGVRLSTVCVTDLVVDEWYYIQVASFDGTSVGPITLDVVCPCPSGACCFDNGTCQELTADDCSTAAGDYQGDGTDCSPNPCPSGACCFEDGSCETWNADGCAAAGGYYRGDGTDCDPNPCLLGACCFGNGTCQVMLPEACTVAGGSYEGDETSCDPNPCVPENNDCADALLIACDTQVVVDNTNATTEPEDPPFSCHYLGPDHQGMGTVWFKFVATDTDALVSTCNSTEPGLDTEIAVYSGTCGAFTELACSEDALGECGRLSEVCVSGLTVDETYYIQVATFDFAPRGEITLDLTCPCPP